MVTWTSPNRGAPSSKKTATDSSAPPVRSTSVFRRVHWKDLEEWILIDSIKAGGGPTILGRFSTWPLWVRRGLKPQLPSKPEFRKALKDSIASEGLRNPILIFEIDGKLFVRYGVSRCLTVRELQEEGRGDGTLPAIISGPTPGVGATVSPANFLDYFVDPPLHVVWQPDGRFDFSICYSSWDIQAHNPAAVNRQARLKDNL